MGLFSAIRSFTQVTPSPTNNSETETAQLMESFTQMHPDLLAEFRQGTGQAGGVLTPGNWVRAPTIARVMLNGTGTVQIDGRNRSGTITMNVAGPYTLTGAVNQVDLTYPGDDIVEVRVTTTGTAKAEIL